VIRPLLFATREQIAAYAIEIDLKWRVDESNVTDDYQRNLIRHHVVPVLREINPSLMHTCQQGLQRMQGDLELLTDAFESWKKEFVIETSERSVLDKKGFDRFKNQVPLLWRYIKKFDFNYSQAGDIIQGMNGQPGKLFFSPSHQLVVDRTTIIITKHTGEIFPLTIDEHDNEATVGPWHLQFFKGTETHLNGSIDATLDADRLTFPLTLRKWRYGDAFQPLGMKHTKKLSDFFIDNKVSMADKEVATVIESHGTIVYVVGWRIDDRFKVTSATKNVFYVRVQKPKRADLS
jgi:tRNA(Ile)-lysidine synthase